MTLHFAYGANMSRAVMGRHAHAARPLGIAGLAGHRFIITTDGYGSVEPVPAGQVYGVLWRLTPRDRVTLDAWENVEAGLYRTATLPVRYDDGRKLALIYLARPRGEGRAKAVPKPGYIELVVAAAREWELPAPYIRSLQAWGTVRPLGSGGRKIGEFR
jgi:hypothetical protein